MDDRRLQRQLRRINGEAPFLRVACGLVALVCVIAALLAREAPATALVLALAAFVPGALWLRRYNQARPFASTVVHDLAAGAFLGGLVAAVAIDSPESLHGWLRIPAERAAPAAVAVVMAAVLEDLARELLGALRVRR